MFKYLIGGVVCLFCFSFSAFAADTNDFAISVSKGSQVFTKEFVFDNSVLGGVTEGNVGISSVVDNNYFIEIEFYEASGNDLSHWFQFSEGFGPFYVEAGEEILVPYVFNIPDDALFSEYKGSFSAYSSDDVGLSEMELDSVGVGIRLAKGIKFLVEFANFTEEYDVVASDVDLERDSKDDLVLINYSLVNNSNVIVSPFLDVSVKDRKGEILFEDTYSLKELRPFSNLEKGTVSLTEDVLNVFPYAVFDLEFYYIIDLEDGSEEKKVFLVADSQMTKYLMPFVLSVVIVVFICLIIFFKKKK